MKTVLLCRVSSKEQEETGYSLPAQEKLLSSYAEKKDFDVNKIFSIAESASGKKQREIFDEMMGFVSDKDIKIIICEKVDRLTRNFKDAVLIDEWLEKDEQRQVHLVKDSLILHKNSRSQEKLNWGIRILFSKNYIDNLSEEVKKGQKEKIAQGWLPTKPPTGYKTIGEKGHKTHIVDEKKAPLIKEMFDLAVTGGYSVMRLAEAMKEKGLTNNYGRVLLKSRIHRLLRDPFYYGKFIWNDKIYDGKQEPLISKEQFDRVGNILTDKCAPKLRKHSFEFQGLIRCGDCGCCVTWEVHKKKAYGRCNHYKPCSQKSYVSEMEVEDQLLNCFDNLVIKNKKVQEWIRKALKEHHHDNIETRTVAIDDLQIKLKGVLNRIDKLYDDKLDGKITQEYYDKKFEQFKKDEVNLEELIQKNSNSQLKYYELGINFYEISQKGKIIYQKASLEDKKEFIRMIFDKLTLHNKILSYEYSKPYKILREIVEATNSSEVGENEEKIMSTLEPKEMIDGTVQTPSFFAYRPLLLPRQDLNLEPCRYTCSLFFNKGWTISFPFIAELGIARLVSEPSLNQMCSDPRLWLRVLI